jgi:hypothetical protein
MDTYFRRKKYSDSAAKPPKKDVADVGRAYGFLFSVPRVAIPLPGARQEMACKRLFLVPQW